MFGARVWGPVAVIAFFILTYITIELLRSSPHLRLWVVFMLALAATVTATMMWLVVGWVDRRLRAVEYSTTEAEIVAFEVPAVRRKNDV